MTLSRNPAAGLQTLARTRRDASARVVVTTTPVAADPATADGEGDLATPAPSGRTAELWLYGTVGGYWWGFDSDAVAEALREMGDVTDITVRLHSFGGSAIEGIAIANLLANHPAAVRVVVDGIAASAATQIALCGSELIMSPGSQFMVHDVWTWTSGNAADLRAEADWVEKQSANYAETYAHRAGGTAAEWRARMIGPDGEDGTWYSAAETVAAGLADRVENIASTTPPPPMPDHEDLDDDGDYAAARAYDLEVLLDPAARAAWSQWRPGAAPTPPVASASGSTQKKGAAVDLNSQQIAALREQVGFAEDADADSIVAAVTEALGERADASTTTDVPEGMSLVSTEVLTELRQGAEDGRAARAEQRTAARDRSINDAVRTGRIAPSQREHFSSLYDADPAGTAALLNKLEPGLVPLAEIGHDQANEADEDAAFEAAHSAFLAQQGINTSKEA